MKNENLNSLSSKNTSKGENSMLEKEQFSIDGRDNKFAYHLNAHNCDRKKNSFNFMPSLEELSICLMETSHLIDRVLDEIQPDFYQKYCVLRGALEEIQRILEKALKEDEN